MVLTLYKTFICVLCVFTYPSSMIGGVYPIVYGRENPASVSEQMRKRYEV